MAVWPGSIPTSSHLDIPKFDNEQYQKTDGGFFHLRNLGMLSVKVKAKTCFIRLNTPQFVAYTKKLGFFIQKEWSPYLPLL